MLDLLCGHDEWTTGVSAENRAKQLRSLFGEFEDVTGGELSIEGLRSAQAILDIGMEKGGLGLMLRKLEMRGVIMGVDLKQYPDGLYANYSHTSFTSIQAAMDTLKKQTFSHVLCMAPQPSDVGAWVMNHWKEFSLSEEGMVFVATEHPFPLVDGFTQYKSVSGYKNLYLAKK
ncbi:MAG: hypothetical protein UT26_C0007G0018 [Microgenomates group bacterium GW2011_GWC1_39_12]|nr:MAG: hypothetical protein UT26_C0007G0018 [Microgenomates group bacterium GW2011_GWC1_39_12]